MPHDPTEPNPNAPAGNPPDMTDAERDALNPQDPPSPEPITGEPAPGDPPAADGTPAPAPAPDTSPEPPAPFIPATTAPAARDFAAEIGTVKQDLLGLRQKLSAGEIDDDQYFEQFEALNEKKSQLTIDQRLHEDRVAQAVANSEQAWNYMVERFRDIPDNAALRNPYIEAAWEAAMQEVFAAASASGRQLTDWQLMQEGRAKLAEQGLIQAAVPAPAAAPAPPAPPPRNPPMGNVPQQLSAAPSAADPGPRASAEALAGMDVEELETRLAGLSDAARDELLRGTPGTFLS
jgi:hypothetical protein